MSDFEVDRFVRKPGCSVIHGERTEWVRPATNNASFSLWKRSDGRELTVPSRSREPRLGAGDLAAVEISVLPVGEKSMVERSGLILRASRFARERKPSDVGLGKVFSLVEKGLITHFGESVGKAVPIIESRRMASLAELAECPASDVRLLDIY
jgi:hypothetical protein